MTPTEVRWLVSAGSTNDVLRELARNGAAHGTAVATDTQTSGRGRLGRTWEARPGMSLALSVLVRRPLVPARVPLLGLGAAVAASEACGPSYTIKWPNDLLASDGRKVAGILAEAEWEGSRPAWVVLGIGINVFGAPDLPTASFLAAHGPAPTLPALAALVTERTLAWSEVLATDPAALLAAWRARARLGGTVRVGEVAGIAEDIDADGALLVRTADGRRVRVTAGDVSPIGRW